MLAIVQLLSHVWLLVTPWTAARQLPCPSLSPGICSDSCPLSQWFYLTISSFAVSFSFCLLFSSIRVFSSESALHIRWPKYWSFSFSSSNEYSGWFPLGLIVLISLQSKGFSIVFSNTTIQMHRFFSTQASLWSNSHLCTCLLEKP